MNDDARLLRGLRGLLAGVAVCLGALVAGGQDGDPQGSGKLTVREVDGSPSLRYRTLIVGNGDLTDNGDGTMTLDTAGAVAAISDLSDVAAITTQTDGQVLTYDTTDGWRNEDAAGAASLAETLVVGATTGGTSLTMTAGDAILGSANELLFGSSVSPVTSLSVVVATDGDTLDVSVSGERVTISALGTTIAGTVADLWLTSGASVRITDLGAAGDRPFYWQAGPGTGDTFQVYNDSSIWYFRPIGGLEIENLTSFVLGPSTTLQLGNASVTDSIALDTAGAISLDSTTTTSFEVGATSEVLTITGGSNTLTLAAGTAATLALASDSAAASLTGATDVSLVGTAGDVIVTAGDDVLVDAADAIVLDSVGTTTLEVGATSEALVFTGTGNLITIDSTASGAALTVNASGDVRVTSASGGLVLTASGSDVDVESAATIRLDSTTTTMLELGATSEQLTLTGGTDTITIDAGTGSALAVTSALGTTITASGGDATIDSDAGDVVLLAFDDVLLNPVDDVTVTLDALGVLRVVDTLGGELTITPDDAAESVTVAAVGVSADLVLTAPGTLALTSTDAALALTADSGGVTVTDSAETLTISTTGANAMLIDAGTGSALTITSALGTTITATGGDVRLEPTGDEVVVAGDLQAWHASEAAGDYSALGHNATHGTLTTGSGNLRIVPAGGSTLAIGGIQSWHAAEGAGDYVWITHDATNANILTGSGDLICNPTGGDVILADGDQLQLGSTATYVRQAAGLVTLTDAVSTQIASLVMADGTWASGLLQYGVECTNGTEYQSVIGELAFTIVDDAGGVVATINSEAYQTAVSSGTITVTAYSVTTTDDQDIEIMLTVDSSLVPTTLRARVSVTLTSLQAVSIP